MTIDSDTAAQRASAPARAVRLPPGQHQRPDFPRFGTHLHLGPPEIPDVPAIEIAGAVSEVRVVPLTRVAALPRREQSSALHCVAGWSAAGLRWEGVPF